MTVVLDSSVVVAALLDAGPDGTWAEHVLASGALMAPHLMPVEAANILRRAWLAGEVEDEVATSATQTSWQFPLSCSPMNPSPTGFGNCAVI